MVSFGGGHVRGSRALLRHVEAKATREIGVFASERGRSRLQRLENIGVFLLSQGESAGIRCGTSWTLHIRRRAGSLQAGLCIMEGDRAKPGSEGRLHSVPDLVQVTEVGGGCRESIRAAHADPRGHGGVRT